MTENDNNCKITLYLDTPKMLLKPGLDREYGSLFFGGITDSTWLTGHAFIGITDEYGKEQKWGYGPTALAGDDLKQYTSGCSSVFKNEDKSHYTEAIIYPICRKQYDLATKKIEDIKKDSGVYKLFSHNCSTVSSEILKAAGVKAPTGLVGLTPHGLVLKKRMMLASYKAKTMLNKARENVLKFFGNKTAPNKLLLEQMRHKPIPVSIKEGMRANRQKKPLNSDNILATLLKVRSGYSK